MLTINQVLVICLILVLIAFVVVLAKMAVPAVELLKKTKELEDDGQKAIDSTKAKVNEVSDKVINAAVSVASDSSPVLRAAAVGATGILAISLIRSLINAVTGRSVILSTVANRRANKQARKELKKSRKTLTH